MKSNSSKIPSCVATLRMVEWKPRTRRHQGREISMTTRGFFGRRRSEQPSGRVPPGQYLTDGFPVLSAGPTPHMALDRWSFSFTQGDKTLASWTWQEFLALPRTQITVDIHCVTKWSKL